MIGRLLGGLATLVGYVCTATVMAALVGLVYLWHTDRLSDQKVFRMMTLFHDIDLTQLAEAQRKKSDEVPPEEVSLDEALRRQQVMDRNFEVKLVSLRREKQEFDHSRQQLTETIDRYDRIAQDWQNKFKQQEELSNQQNLSTVVSQLEAINPPQAKDALLRWVKDGKTDDAILLMSKMSESKLKKILQRFQTPEELTTLYEIHRRIIDKGQKSKAFDEVIEEFNSANAAN
jgi:hypothetical protein